MADLSTKYMGLDLRNPIVVASSGLTDSVDDIVKLDKSGAGAVVLKSIFEEQILLEAEHSIKKMQEDSFAYDEYSETLDYIDVHIKEKEVSNYIELIKQAKSKVSIPIIASINAVTAMEWTSFAKQIEQAGADAIELNIFVMPFDTDKECTENEEIYYKILKKVKENVNIPVSVKLSPYFSNLGKVLMNLEKEGADSMVLFNRFSAPDIDIENIKTSHAEIFSHPNEMYNVLRWVGIMANKLNADLSATTGIHDGASVIKMLLAGAATVQVSSALYKNGVGYISTMLNDIHGWMDKKGFRYVDQFRGKLAHKADDNNNVFERMQFMRYFSDIK
jgi:dihydroorotate dehydrogenase (fumarate)